MTNIIIIVIIKIVIIIFVTILGISLQSATCSLDILECSTFNH